MNFTRSALTYLALSAALAGCSSADTIVALNVDTNNPAALGDLTVLAVTFEKEGRNDFEVELNPTLETDNRGNKLFPGNYFSRITMPDGWSGRTDVLVEARANRRLIISGVTDFFVHENETTAAFVNLEFEEEMEPPIDMDSGVPDAGDGTETTTTDTTTTDTTTTTDEMDSGVDTADADAPTGASDAGDAATVDAATDTATTGGDTATATAIDAGDAG